MAGYGRTLIQRVELPAEALERFAAFNAKAGRNSAGFTPDTDFWEGEAVKAPPSGNPYVLVVKASGTVAAEGEASMRWNPGWKIEGNLRATPLAPTRKAGAAAGEKVELVSTTSPLSFKEDRKVLPVVGFVEARNLRLEKVELEVWSGIDKPTDAQLFQAWVPLMVGVLFIAAVVYWRRRSR